MNKQKIILITGTSKSIGEYLVKYYLQKNFKVIGCSRQKVDRQSDNHRHFSLDIRDEKQLMLMFAEIAKTEGYLSVLINNAGVQLVNHSLLTCVDSVSNVLQTNMIAPFLLCRESAKLMKNNNYGRIINISSIAVPLYTVGNSIYSASKAALEQFSRIFAREVALYGITVNILGLSIVKNSGMAKNISDKAIKEALAQTIIKEQISFEDISNAIDFFIMEQSKMVTGQTIYLGGV